MGTTIATRQAKCKDCKFLKPTYKGKLKRHICRNIDSKYFVDMRRLEDLVCDNWVLYGLG